MEIECYFCKELLGERVAFHNNEGDSFILMPKGTAAHLECYVKQCCEIKRNNGIEVTTKEE